VLEAAHAKSLAEQQPLRLVWHTFERARWRPADLGSDDPRRSWWNVVAPNPSGVTHPPFVPHAFGINVNELLSLAFLVDKYATITVMAETLFEAGAIVNLEMKRINAAIDGLPYP
jgi:hypothetical protein